MAVDIFGQQRVSALYGILLPTVQAVPFDSPQGSLSEFTQKNETKHHYNYAQTSALARVAGFRCMRESFRSACTLGSFSLKPELRKWL